jgi:hypothetical protein
VPAGFWREDLGAPVGAPAAARAVNALIDVDEARLFRAGAMLGGGPPNWRSGPVWAAAGTELVPSWLAAPQELTFHQLHGHSSLVDWKAGRWLAGTAVSEVTRLDTSARHTTSTVGDHLIVGVDPCHGYTPSRNWAAYVIPDAVVVA